MNTLTETKSLGVGTTSNLSFAWRLFLVMLVTGAASCDRGKHETATRLPPAGEAGNPSGELLQDNGRQVTVVLPAAEISTPTRSKPNEPVPATGPRSNQAVLSTDGGTEKPVAGALSQTRGKPQVIAKSLHKSSEPKIIPVGPSAPPPPPVYNELVLKAIKSMPERGGYAATRQANYALREALSVRSGLLTLDPHKAQPSYCSGATYLVFLDVVLRASDRNKVKVTESTTAAMLVAGQPDGHGVWGRWNANGPGTARLFFESGLGVNFEDWSQVRQGDFMKIFWNDHIGKRETGHSVVYLEQLKLEDGEPGVKFWSSNIPDGYGAKIVPLKSIKRVLFSRLTNPSAINRVSELPPTDDYLAEMVKRDGTREEMLANVGIVP